MRIQKVLIANRGEIASRIIRACKKRSIQSVAVYSEADHEMPFVREADESVFIGPPPVAQSYLQIERIIEAAKQTGAQAIHPGYGLLSENDRFAERCRQEGITFIGPSPEAIRMMGDKIEARRRMEQAGVPILPGSKDPVETVAEARAIAAQIGYPIMLKARAGGGGIAMRICQLEQEIMDAFDSIKARAKAYFGNEELYVEKYIERSRHIEAQIAADAYGTVVHLFERDCSIQRRHQKVIEESPSPFLDEKLRESLCQSAILAARSTQYCGVGTVEFIVSPDRSFYFLEMNARLQVEHAVTEELTGIDLVSLQIDIAEGKRLPFRQEQIKARGHVIEARIYAEDPISFLPSPGKIAAYKRPTGNNVRMDDGVETGSIVTPYYDPLIAKLICRGSGREEAIRVALTALREMKIEGIKTNIPFLERALRHEKFQRGEYDTRFVDTDLSVKE